MSNIDGLCSAHYNPGMTYIIDGHNLIPKLPGLSLRAIDDEQQLIALLQEFARRERKQIEVYFDNAPPGQARAQHFGTVQARFVRQGRTADAAISDRLRRLEKKARNWTVVSSDHAVQVAARSMRARVLSSEAFARKLLAALEKPEQERHPQEEGGLPPEELDDWLALFGVEDE